MIKTVPIRPDQVTERKIKTHLPSEVFEAFNDAITKHWDGTRSVVPQDEVVAAILARKPGTERHVLFENRWIDIEDAYRAAGWQVEYDKPGFNESGAAKFTFSRRMR